MLRDIFTDKWILGGITLLIIIAGACYFWYQHSLADDRKAAAETAEFARQWERNRQAKQKAAKAETRETKAPAENTSAEAPIHPELPQIGEIVDGRIFLGTEPLHQNSWHSSVCVLPHKMKSYHRMVSAPILNCQKGSDLLHGHAKTLYLS